MAESDISLIINVRGKEQLKEAADEFARNARVSAQLAKQYDAVAAKNLRVIKEARRLKALKKDLRREVKLYNDSEGKLGITTHKYTQIMKEEIRVSKEKVLTDRRLIAAAQRKAKAHARDTKEVERIRKAYAPAKVAAERFKATIDEIELAFQRGIIKKHEYRESLARTKREFAEFTSGVATGGNQFAKFNTEVYNADQRTKRFYSVGLQQAGYQIGDFAVQMQSGTNVAVAFGQQMSQLLGIFGAGGALAGAAVAISTAFIAPLLEARKEVEDLEDQLQSLFDKLEANRDKTASLIEGGFAGPLERARQAAIRILETFDEIDQRKAKESFAAGILTITDEIEKQVNAAQVAMAGGFNIPLIGPVGQNFSRSNIIGRMTRGAPSEEAAAAEALKELIDLQLMLAEVSKGPADGLAIKATELVEKLEAHGAITETTLKSYKELLETSGLFETAVSKITKEQEKQSEIAKSSGENDQEAIRAAKELQRQRIELNNRRMEHDIRQAKINSDHELALAIKLYKERMKLEDIQQRQENKLFEIRSTAQRNAIASIYEAERVAATKNEDLQEFILTGRNMARMQMLRTISAAEQVEAVKQDKIQQQLDDKRHSQENKRFEVFSNLRRNAIASIYEAERAEIERTANLERFIFTSRNQARVQMLRTISEAEAKFANDQAEAAAKLAEADSRDTEEFITQLANEYKKMVQLRDVSEDQLDLQSALIDAKQEYGSKATKVQMDVIEATLRLIAVERQHQQVVEEARRKQEELSEMLGSSLENAMMSIVDGTATVKDAFKEMAAAIIKDLYRVLVVQQLVASFKTATGPFTSFLSGMSADGNAFSRGNRITAYANGGVVGGPTYFPMSGNRVGLMGEAGPEAIMPLSRGKDGKLGVQASGQGVTVNQNINISTGVQQTVRTEIKSLMPQIAEASKAAVADAKRRGGSYGRTFS